MSTGISIYDYMDNNDIKLAGYAFVSTDSGRRRVPVCVKDGQFGTIEISVAGHIFQPLLKQNIKLYMPKWNELAWGARARMQARFDPQFCR